MQVFEPLQQWPQFVLYKLVPSKKKPGKMDKIPVAPFDRQFDESGINSQRKAWWVDLGTAQAQAQALGNEYGVAFVLTEQDPFFLLDIDYCAQNGQWSGLAQELLGRLAGACVEVSQSGTGLHILGRTEALDHVCKNEPLGLELYTSGRFIALTGNQAAGNIMHDCTVPLREVAQLYFNPANKTKRADWTSEPRADWLGYSDDVELLNAAMQSKSLSGAAFGAGSKATFADLFSRNVAVLAQAYPDPDREFNESQVDAALAQHLAFWTGCDCDRIERLMRQSALVRDKWDTHSTYLELTITKAVGQQTDVHKLKRIQEPEAVQPNATLAGIAPASVSQEPELVSGFQYLGVTQQLEHFAGCVYVQNAHAVLTPDGELLKPEQFKATYGGYLFALDANNDKQTKNAWEVFVESQAIRFPKAHRAWFRPDLPFGQIVEHDGRRWVNTYKPIETKAEPGDVTPFLRHLELLIPNDHDRKVLTAYMAAIVQFKGSKFQWAPLIQGAEGNGKTLFSYCVQYAVGERYSHLPRADEIAEKYNSWLFNNIFIGVEDIYITENKRELQEILKPMITSTRLEERAMQADKIMKPVCCNFIFNSNHQDALRKNRSDRRFAPFFTPQQDEEDIKRDMPGDYFPRLYSWLRNGGFAHVNYYLQTYAIPAELNPALDHGGLANRAPWTTSTDAAVEQSLGRIEQEILEAIDEQRPGFAGGWVSSTALQKLLEDRRAADRIPLNKRKEIMSGLGYIYHPALDHGRASCSTSTDGNRPRIFIKRGHLMASNLTTPKQVVDAYDKAQQEAVKSTTNPMANQSFGQG